MDFEFFFEWIYLNNSNNYIIPLFVYKDFCFTKFHSSFYSSFSKNNSNKNSKHYNFSLFCHLLSINALYWIYNCSVPIILTQKRLVRNQPL